MLAVKRLGSDGTVWAFEPSQPEVSRLERNLDLNDLNAHIFPLALADQAAQVDERSRVRS